MSGRYRIGIDVGGTFTDFVILDQETGELSIRKVATTPEDPSVGVLNGLAEVGLVLGDIDAVTHGTTTATNALIERRGAQTTLLTTEGFRDTLEIRRANRQEMYDAQWVPPAPLVRRRHRLEVRERLSWDGTVVVPMDEIQVMDVIETLVARDVESVAICLINAYQHPVHEERLKQLVQEALPGAFVTASHEVSQELREFERTSTVVANAFVGPTVKKYMHNLRTSLRDGGLRSEISIMQSNGGVCTTEEAEKLPVKLARSGPAGGAMALQHLSELTGIKNLVGVDIGGTSADVCVVVDGRPRWTSPLNVEWGMPLLMPSVDVVSIGAGGGSLAWLDPAGVLHMGPESAGASPGPACYGHGGERPTSTDAHVVLGRVESGSSLGGDITIDRDLATAAVERHVAEPLGMSVVEASTGMLEVLDSAMRQAIRFVTIEKGYDPRMFALVGLGGGGPMHVAGLARELGMSTAIVPPNPGVLSAWGMLTVDMLQDRSRTILRRLEVLDTAELDAVFNLMREDIEDSFRRQGVDPEEVTYEYVLDLQYYGQAYTLAVGLAPSHSEDVRVSEEGLFPIVLGSGGAAPYEVSQSDLAVASETFHHEHEREYGHSDRDSLIQAVHARVFGRHAVGPLPGSGVLPGEGAPAHPIALTTAWFEGEELSTPVFSRSDLPRGATVSGPALIVESSSTTVLPPWAELEVDRVGNLIIATGVQAPT